MFFLLEACRRLVSTPLSVRGGPSVLSGHVAAFDSYAIATNMESYAAWDPEGSRQPHEG
jgi:hypothetical protein